MDAEFSKRIVEKPISVEISYNAKGQMSGSVKVYSDTIEGAWEKACEYSDKLLRQIKEKNGI